MTFYKPLDRQASLQSNAAKKVKRNHLFESFKEHFRVITTSFFSKMKSCKFQDITNIVLPNLKPFIPKSLKCGQRLPTIQS